jgi:uncharacterized membrane protein YkoI
MPMRAFHRRCTLPAALFVALAAGSVRADDVGPDVAKRLLSEGRIKPLSEIIATVQAKVPGEMLEVQLELDDGVYVYELKLLRPNGKVQEVAADAASGNILKIEDDD